MLCVCVFRNRSVGVNCVTGGWFTSAAGPGYWQCDVLYQKKTTCKEVRNEIISFCQSQVPLLCTLSSCVYFLSYYRCLQSISGQSNPVFRSSSTRDSPRLGSTHISQPIFVESSATQACKPLSSAAARPQTGARKPSRAAPEVSFSPERHDTTILLYFRNLHFYNSI